MHGDSVPVIFGLKVRQFREARKLGLKAAAEKAGLSPSYLNEIEKGKKYPKADKIMQLANALGVSYDTLVSLKLDRELNPLAPLLDSPVFRDLPLQLFGISKHDVFDLLTRAPHEAGALVRTLLEIARTYDVHVEHFLYAMLRSYQEAHENYFEDIEKVAGRFRANQGWPLERTLSPELLRPLVEKEYGIAVDDSEIERYPDLRSYRSIWIEGPHPRILLNPHLTASQKAFQLAREIGYREQGLKERGVTSSRPAADSFSRVLNDFKASYFAGAAMIPRERIVPELQAFFARDKWNPDAFLALMHSYEVTPEMFLYRLSQIIPRHFHLAELHFLRFANVPGSGVYRLTKHFNMSQVPIPAGIGLNEHYCRRWLSVEVLQDLEKRAGKGDATHPVIGVQRSVFMDRDTEFFCIALARPLALTAGTNTSVTLGFRMTDRFRRTVRFAEDAAIPRRQLNETCERCGLTPEQCSERAAPPLGFQLSQTAGRRQLQLEALLAEHSKQAGAAD
jgi:transcriptional regulator with XRE-family HTH domain/predicted transcriptional regulator